MFPEKIQKAISILIAIISVIVLAYVGYQGIRYIMQMVRYNRVTNILKIPYSLIYLPLPIGCASMAVQLFGNKMYQDHHCDTKKHAWPDSCNK